MNAYLAPHEWAQICHLLGQVLNDARAPEDSAGRALLNKVRAIASECDQLPPSSERYHEALNRLRRENPPPPSPLMRLVDGKGTERADDATYTA